MKDITLANKLRDNLILRASKYPTQKLHYAEAASWVDLHPHSQEFANLLGDVAQHEYERNRPFLSAIVTYSPTTRLSKINDLDSLHGPGLINRAVYMGLDQIDGFDPLRFGHKQQELAYHYWQNPRRFRQFKGDGFYEENPLVISTPAFFNEEDFLYYAEWIDVVYDSNNPELREPYLFISQNLSQKVQYWADSIAQTGHLTVEFKATAIRLSGG